MAIIPGQPDKPVPDSLKRSITLIH